ncbi:hypothetical protein B9Q04_07890 [Candidatus Marsarchaeota G2 archaeon BE_D]|uniref:Uncharacterized protein n=1 Tax=Candidatus Marsarchaeota G2 archaeon BE_D TaxID=1978158 RepID=A0A2R6CAR1_9ARCH|nr:MAG: hypothetical protein B9Q04_07890 [Candidatus Marsarchaeota G2 archaeon BE_D]
MFGLDSLLAACFSIPSLLLARVRSSSLFFSLVFGIILGIVDSIVSLAYPLSDLIVALMATSAGILLWKDISLRNEILGLFWLF